MLIWLHQNVGNIVVGGIILAVVIWIIVSMIRKKRQGKSSCGCGCKDCGMSGICRGKKER